MTNILAINWLSIEEFYQSWDNRMSCDIDIRSICNEKQE